MQKHWYNIPMDEKNNLDNLLNNKQKFENTFPKVDLNNSIPIDTGTVDSLLDAPIANNQMVNEEVMDEIKTLDTASLKKDVLETQIEIQKSLLESEKVYREGITTIKDLIAPAGVNVKTSMLEIGTKLSRSFFILVYPRVISSGWLEGVVNVDIPLDLSVYIYPKDSSEVLKELKRKVGRIQATLFDNQERGQARDPALETAYQDVEFLRDQIQQGVERFFQVGVYNGIC
jgi:hypothetical protein